MTTFWSRVNMALEGHARIEIERLKVILGVTSDEALAEHIGYSKAAIAKWRMRNSIPDKARAKIASNPSFSKILHGTFSRPHLAASLPDNYQAFSVALMIYDITADSFDFTKGWTKYLFWSGIFPMLVEECDIRIHNLAIERDLDRNEAAEELGKQLARMELAELADFVLKLTRPRL